MKTCNQYSLLNWIKGNCPLWFTCWVTGVIPYMAILQGHLFIQNAFNYENIQIDTAILLTRIDEICFLLFIPLSLIAIANATIKYRGFHLWRFFTFLLFAKGGEIYFNFLMGKWPLGDIKPFIFR